MSTPSQESFNLNLLQDVPAAGSGGESMPMAGADDATGASFAAQMSGGGSQEFILPTEKKKVNPGLLMFVAIAAVAAGGLWWMHSRAGGPNAAEAADPAVDQARASIQQFLSGGRGSVAEMKEMLADSSQITERFATYNEDRQVPLEELKTNPFYLEKVEDGSAEQTGIELSRKQQEELARREAERQRQAEIAARAEADRIAAEAGKLHLQTIFYGKNPTAMINGQICRVGQTLNGFTIVAIRPDGVEVQRDEQTFELRLRS